MSHGAFTLSLALSAAFVAPSASATTVRLLSIQEVAGAANRIVVATIASVEEGADENGAPSSYVTLQVSQSLKGSTPARFTIKQFGSGTTSPAGMRIPAMPTYRPGEEVVLFLHPDSAAGFTSPVGLGQGKYSVVRRDSEAYLHNIYGDASYQRAVARQRTYPPGAAARDEPPAAPQGLIPMAAFLSLVEQIVRENP